MSVVIFELHYIYWLFLVYTSYFWITSHNSITAGPGMGAEQQGKAPATPRHPKKLSSVRKRYVYWDFWITFSIFSLQSVILVYTNISVPDKSAGYLGRFQVPQENVNSVHTRMWVFNLAVINFILQTLFLAYILVFWFTEQTLHVWHTFWDGLEVNPPSSGPLGVA